MELKQRLVFYGFAAGALGASAMFPYRLGVVWGSSMEPSYKTGNVYVMKKLQNPEHEVQRGDVVVFKQEGRTYLKRVLGVPGDGFVVQPRRPDMPMDVLVTRADVERLENIVRRGFPVFRTSQRRVLPGTVYVVGDHLEQSEDSRYFGLVDMSCIIGVVLNSPATQRQDILEVARTQQASAGAAGS